MLLKVNMALVFHILACLASVYSVFPHSAPSQVLPSCRMLPADLTYYGAHSCTVSLRSTLFCYNHQLPGVCLCLYLVVNVGCMLTMYFKVKSVGSSFSLTMLEKKLNDEVTGIKKGGGCICQPPSTSLTRVTLGS